MMNRSEATVKRKPKRLKHLPIGHRIVLHARKGLLHGEQYGHLAYFAIVAVEAHATYAWVAGGLFCIGVVAIVMRAHVMEEV